ncbi:MAG: cupin domain-containing protein [Gammaproteobacteria bacterium]
MNRTIVERQAWLATACCIVALALAPLALEARAGEPAIAWTADDAGLQWGGCPDFLPAGCAIAVLHGDPAKANVDILFKVPAHSTIPLHTHSSAERMVLISGELQVSYEGQAAVRLVPGSYAYGPAGRAHSGRCTSDVACVLFIAFESPLDAIPSAASN